MSLQEIQEMANLKRFKESQDVKIEWKNILDSESYKLIMSQCDELSCAEELVAFPILTSVAHFMGTMATVKIDADWTEPVSLMCLLVARRGERKTCAVHKTKQICLSLENEIGSIEDLNKDKVSSIEMRPVVLIDENNIRTDLDSTLSSEKSSPLVIIDDFKDTIDSLENSKEDIFTNSRLKEIYGCGIENPLRRHLNFIGTVQALDVHSVFENRNRIAMFDRSLIVCCKNFSPEVSKEIQSDSGTMQAILSSIWNFHSDKKEQAYTFNAGGQKEFTRCLEIFQRMKRMYVDNKMVFGSINQAGGHLARLSAILTALKNGVALSNNNSHIPSRSIDLDTVKRAYQIVRFVLQQKLCLFASKADDEWPEMTEENDGGSWPNEYDNQSDKSAKVTTSGHGFMDGYDDDIIEIAPSTGRVERIVAGKSDIDVKNYENNYVHVDGLNRTIPENEMVVLKNHYQTLSPHEMGYQNVRPEMDNRLMDYFVPITSQLPEQREAKPPPMSVGPSMQNGRLKSNSPHSNTPSPSVSNGNNFEKPKTKRAYRPSQKSLPQPFDGCYYDADDEIFFQQCANKIKKLLLTHGAIVTASYACQYRLFPPVPMDLRQKSPRTSHPSWAASRFFERLEGLELGTMHVLRGHSVRFLKESFSKMSDKAKEILRRLRIQREEYEDTFPETTVFDELKLLQMKRDQEENQDQIVFNNQ